MDRRKLYEMKDWKSDMRKLTKKKEIEDILIRGVEFTFFADEKDDNRLYIKFVFNGIPYFATNTKYQLF